MSVIRVFEHEWSSDGSHNPTTRVVERATVDDPERLRQLELQLRQRYPDCPRVLPRGRRAQYEVSTQYL